MENGDRPATKKDLDQLREANKQDLIDMETWILKAFYSYARTNDKNIKQLAEDAVAHDWWRRLQEVYLDRRAARP